MTERVVDPAQLRGIGWVTASHVHTDHLDPETLGPLVAGNPGLRLVFPEAIRAAAAQRSGLSADHLQGLDAPIPGRDRKLASPDSLPLAPGILIRAVPAAHETLDCDSQGRLICVGFILRVGPWVLYHSGDTVLYPGQEPLLREAGVDIAFLPINGRAPERRVTGNLWGDEAARLAKGIEATVAIPGHYDLFEFNTATTERFVMSCQQVGQGFAVLRAGERWTAPPPRRTRT
jgi:L-ascorbate metabolism protein UlaG (beta-lactamase superfamily)